MALALADFKRRVAEDIHLLGAGVSFPAEDEALIGDLYSDVYHELEIQGLIDWGVSEAIPNEYVGVMVEMVGARTAPKFMIPPRDGTRWKDAFEVAENRLRKLLSNRHTSKTIKATYF